MTLSASHAEAEASAGEHLHLVPSPAVAVPAAQQTKKGSKAFPIFLILLLGGGGYAAWHFFGGAPAEHEKKEGHEGHETKEVALPVQVVSPKPGGVARVTNQAGSVHSFESAELFAKISGYLDKQGVDIGDKVKRDDILAVIYAPELHEAVNQMKAALDTANAQVVSAEKKVASADAEVKAAVALVAQAQAAVLTAEANVSLHTKALSRIQGLVQRKAIEEKLEDEEIDKMEAAKSNERFAKASVLSAEAQVLAKEAMLEQARADLKEAKANVEVAMANLEKAKVMESYTLIKSPYDGVITKRSFHRGDFIRSAAEGGNIPVLSVARTDLMRVVLPVPDVEVPYVDKGDPAVLRITALPRKEFKGTVARFAESEDPDSRNMRTEIDLPNPDDILKDGMYGRIEVILEPPSKEALTIPSSALQSQSNSGEGQVFVVKDGKTKKVKVRVGADNGVESEILEGLSPSDQVIAKYNGAMAEGLAVRIEAAKQEKSGH